MKKTLWLLATLLVFGCAGSAPSPQVQQAVTDASLIVNGVAAEVKQIQLLYPNAIPADKTGALLASLGAAQTALAQLQTVTSMPATGTQLQTIEQNINSVLGIVSTGLGSIPACQLSPICQTISVALGAASVLLPGVDAVVTQIATGTAPAPAPMATYGMTPDQARMTLAAAARR